MLEVSCFDPQSIEGTSSKVTLDKAQMASNVVVVEDPFDLQTREVFHHFPADLNHPEMKYINKIYNMYLIDFSRIGSAKIFTISFEQ